MPGLGNRYGENWVNGRMEIPLKHVLVPGIKTSILDLYQFYSSKAALPTWPYN